MRFEVTALSGFRRLCGLSFGWGHGDLLHTVPIAVGGMKETMSHGVLIP